jgi:hypothetical protein
MIGSPGFRIPHIAAPAVIALLLLSQGVTAHPQSDPGIYATPPEGQPHVKTFNSDDYGVVPPKLIRPVTAEYTDEAKLAQYRGVCIVDLVVDAHGVPEEVWELRPVGWVWIKERSMRRRKNVSSPGPTMGSR